MRDDELRQRFRDRNPWWLFGAGGDVLGWTERDVTLTGVTPYDVGYEPPALDGIGEGDLCVLRGPRRVGKSVALKRHVRRLLSNDVRPEQIIYLALNDFSARDLRRALTIGRALTRSVGDNPRYWLFDEITAVKGWAPIIKDARDETPLAHDTVILTGSSAVDLSEARSTLGAGRSGQATRRFRLLLPMSFRNFLSCTGRELPEVPRLSPTELQGPPAKGFVEQLEPFVDEIDLAWQEYCEVGGFPRAVGELQKQGRISDAFCHDLVDWLAPDVMPDEPQDSVLTLLSTLGSRMTSPLDVKNTAAQIGLSREQLRVRLNRLVHTIAGMWCHQINADGHTVANSQSKFYLLDPLLVRLPHLLDPAHPVPDMTKVTEAALAGSLARAIDFHQHGRLLEGRALGYVRTGSGREIDFGPLPLRIGGVNTVSTPLESKWVATGWRSDALTIENKYREGVVATKNIVEVEGYPTWAIPVGILALMLQ
jgi:predicted AAA+ superfamily ATPase